MTTVREVLEQVLKRFGDDRGMVRDVSIQCKDATSNQTGFAGGYQPQHRCEYTIFIVTEVRK